jgi:hypothetical protein
MTDFRGTIDAFKQILRRTPFYGPFLRRRYLKDVRAWESRGCPIPVPHLIKQRTLLEYAEAFRLDTLIETGTHYGAMVEAMRSSFRQVFSIELDPYLYERARKRFMSARNVKILHGDSGIVLKAVVAELNSAALFWLDAHYSGGVTAKGDKETPILEELDTIFSSSADGHVIVIDDARAFGQDPMYPAYPTMEELQQFVMERGNKNLVMTVKWDIIRITPKPLQTE